MYSFSACMTSKMSLLKFGARKFERVQWSHKPFEKNWWSRTSNFPIKSPGSPNFIIARVSNLPPLKLMFHCVIRGPFPVFLRSFSSPQFPHYFIEGFQFAHCDIKGQRTLKCFHCAINGPQFPHHAMEIMTFNFS